MKSLNVNGQSIFKLILFRFISYNYYAFTLTFGKEDHRKIYILKFYEINFFLLTAIYSGIAAEDIKVYRERRYGQHVTTGETTLKHTTDSPQLKKNLYRRKNPEINF